MLSRGCLLPGLLTLGYLLQCTPEFLHTALDRDRGDSPDGKLVLAATPLLELAAKQKSFAATVARFFACVPAPDRPFRGMWLHAADMANAAALRWLAGSKELMPRPECLQWVTVDVPRGRNALHLAVARCPLPTSLATVRLLLELGVDPTAKSEVSACVALFGPES
jgi:hypothetical protein